MTRVTLALTTVIVLVLGFTPLAAADEVQLKNGDRYTGTVTGLAGGTLTFKTAHGTLKMPWAEVTSLDSSAMLLATVGTADPVAITAIAPAGPGRVTLTPGGQVALADIAALAPVAPPVSITGGANAGLVRTAGNTDVNSLRLDTDVTIREHANRYTAAAIVNQANDRGVDTADNWTTAFNYDRFLTERLFLNANAIFTGDSFRDLDLRSAIGGGVGYQVLQGPRTKLTVNGGIGWVNEDLIVGEDTDYAAFREGAALDIALVPSRVDFFHKHDGYFGVDDDNLFIKMQNGIRLSIVAGFVTTVQYDFDYDPSPSPGRDETDSTFALTFGYRF